MSVVRAPRPTRNFYMLDKRISEDKRLGWAARGLLIYLLGKPDDWRVSIPALIAETANSGFKTGRDGVYRILQELKDAGYARHVQTQAADGKISGCDWVIGEQPQMAPLPDNPTPHRDLPDTGLPYRENPDVLLSTESLPRTDRDQEIATRSSELPLGLSPVAAKGASKAPVKIDLPPLVETWNSICGPTVGKLRKLTPEREKLLRQAMRDEFENDPERWMKFCRRITRSPFLTGTSGSKFKPDFNWMLNPENLVKILEGRYHDQPSQQSTYNPYLRPGDPGWRPSPGTI
jgi:hypothetical protein